MQLLHLSWKKSLLATSIATAIAATPVTGIVASDAPVATGEPPTPRLALRDKEDRERGEVEDRRGDDMRRRLERRADRIREALGSDGLPAEKREVLERDLREIERHFRELEDGELEAHLQAIGREIQRSKRAGRYEEAERLARNAGRIKQKLRRRREAAQERPRKRREEGDGGRRPMPEREAMMKRVRHLHAAADNLQAAGMEREAHQLHQQAERMERELHRRPEGPDRDRPEPGDPDLRRVVHDLHMQVERLRRQVAEMQVVLHRLVQKRKERGEKARDDDR